MDVLERAVCELAEPVVEATGYELVRVKIFGAKRKTLQVMAERPEGGMEIEDCATLSRALSAAFDVADPIEGEWVLEVSSPGVDRPLTRPKDFERWSGFETKIELTRMVDERKRYKGVLLGLDGDDVMVKLDGVGETRRLPFHLIKEAKLVLTDELMKVGRASTHDLKEES